MAPQTHSLDLASLHLDAGEGRRLELGVPIEPVEFGGQVYAVLPSPVPTQLDVSRTTAQGWALRLNFTATLEGPCMRCLEPASPAVEVEAREVHQPNSGEELSSPYMDEQVLELSSLARDALVLALPVALLCAPDCAGLCPVCGENLNLAGEDHGHESSPDPRWAKLRELKLE